MRIPQQYARSGTEIDDFASVDIVMAPRKRSRIINGRVSSQPESR